MVDVWLGGASAWVFGLGHEGNSCLLRLNVRFAPHFGHDELLS